jgi:hypothetical protein
MWRKDGRELYFVGEDHKLMAVDVKPAQSSLEFTPPKPLFEEKTLGTNFYTALDAGGRALYAPSSDGQRFLFLVPVENERPESLHYIHNWNLAKRGHFAVLCSFAQSAGW